MATGGAASTLRRFELHGVHDTGREVGHGSYAVVKELKFRGLKCVGKKIHDILFSSATPKEQAALLECFAGECELADYTTRVSYSSLVCALSRHPHCLCW